MILSDLHLTLKDIKHLTQNTFTMTIKTHADRLGHILWLWFKSYKASRNHNSGHFIIPKRVLCELSISSCLVLPLQAFLWGQTSVQV